MISDSCSLVGYMPRILVSAPLGGPFSERVAVRGCTSATTYPVAGDSRLRPSAYSIAGLIKARRLVGRSPFLAPVLPLMGEAEAKGMGVLVRG